MSMRRTVEICVSKKKKCIEISLKNYLFLVLSIRVKILAKILRKILASSNTVDHIEVDIFFMFL